MFQSKTPLLLLLVNLLAVNAQTNLSFAKNWPFGKPVSVKFDTASPTSNDYIGIYYHTKDDSLTANPFDNYDTLFWAYTSTKTQEWDEEIEKSEGKILFNGVDPSEQGEIYWPMNPRMYKVCFMREGDVDGTETGTLLGECKVLRIKMNKNKKKKVAKKAVVRAKKPEYQVGDEVNVFFKLPFKVANSWVGIYDIKNLDDSITWLYTGCNNVAGDQVDIPSKSNDCIAKRKKGALDFNATNTGRDDDGWPLKAGTYTLKVQLYNNSPHAVYKQAKETFEVKENDDD
mmetsp:Transcript_31338/g.37289  ORF Transcript_31338/g.37289 Transcript_31338/m.37289 type:complete len:286 (-) Transcript_31338:291-1148(-)